MNQNKFQSFVHKMPLNKVLSIRKRVRIFYMKNKQMKKSLILNHFRFEGIPKSTIYDIINRVDNGISIDQNGHLEELIKNSKTK
jgi:hypothetical protein